MSQSQNCQYKILDRVYYANYDELVDKIKKGSVLRQDQVKIGNTAWTEAEKVARLAIVFEETEQKLRLPEGIDLKNIMTNFQVEDTDRRPLQEIEKTDGKTCALHSERRPYYICTVCENLFCKECPLTDPENGKACLFCGGKCVLYMGQMWRMDAVKPEAKYEPDGEEEAAEPREPEIVYTKLTLKDFINALVHPFRFPLGLLGGGGLFSVLVLGEIVTLFQGGWMLAATLLITGVIMVLKFGILSKSFENFKQSDFKHRTFLPQIRKFTIWEDFISPFFTGLSSYLLSFGLFIALIVVATTYGWFSYASGIEAIESEMLQTGERVSSVIDGGERSQNSEARLRAMIDKMRNSQLEAAFGSNHLVNNKEFVKLIYSVLRLTLWFQVPLYFAFIFGILVFPAICLSTGENPFQPLKKRFFAGFKMMRTIGFDYVKILFMSIVLLMLSAFAVSGLNWLFSKFEMPVAGIFAAIVTGSFFVFYFWTVFSGILGIALFNKETVFEIPDHEF